MKLRKVIAVTAVLASCALLMTACGKDNTEGTASAGSESESTSDSSAAVNDTESETESETETPAVSEDVPEDIPNEDNVEDVPESAANPLQPIADAALAVGEWPTLWEVTDTQLMTDYFLLDSSNENYKNILILQCPMSANMTEIILIEAEDVSAAKADLEARQKKAQEQDAFYPDDVERAAASIVGTEGDYAYYLVGDNTVSAETEIVNYIKNMQ